jgi:hypothetical protein
MRCSWKKIENLGGFSIIGGILVLLCRFTITWGPSTWARVSGFLPLFSLNFSFVYRNTDHCQRLVRRKIPLTHWFSLGIHLILTVTESRAHVRPTSSTFEQEQLPQVNPRPSWAHCEVFFKSTTGIALKKQPQPPLSAHKMFSNVVLSFKSDMREDPLSITHGSRRRFQAWNVQGEGNV